jgi:hypothetical protein
MLEQALQQRIIETADEYHFTAEAQWSQVVDLEPTDEDLSFEFRRLVRAALVFYMRAYLMLDMIETDDEQQLEDLVTLVNEQQPEVAEFLQKNNAVAVLDEESDDSLSRVFTVAEAYRTLLLDRSNQLAASLGTRFGN